MNVQSNSYTVVYASILVVVVAIVLTCASVLLQPTQQKNIDNEKRQNILSTLNIESTPEQAEDIYNQYIKETFVVDGNGSVVEGVEAFDVDMVKVAKQIATLTKATDDNAKAEAKKALTLPVFKAVKNDSVIYVLPVRGNGLWGPVWGYVSLLRDMSTVYGVIFDHASETAGLGAEITKELFTAPFAGKTIFNAGEMVGIEICKGGVANSIYGQDKSHSVDAISGATLTSKGIQAMIFDCFTGYTQFFKNNMAAATSADSASVQVSDSTIVDSLNIVK